MDRVRCTAPASACRAAAMAGNAGRYMSIDSGPIAVSMPSSISQGGRPRIGAAGGAADMAGTTPLRNKRVLSTPGAAMQALHSAPRLASVSYIAILCLASRWARPRDTWRGPAILRPGLPDALGTPAAAHRLYRRPIIGE